MTTIRDIFPDACEPRKLPCGLQDIICTDDATLDGADVDRRATADIRYYADCDQFEELSGHAYDFYPGSQYEDEDDYQAPVYLAVVTSDNSQIVFIDADLYTEERDAVSRAETMAQWIAEHEYAHDYVRNQGAHARMLLDHSHATRREGVRLLRLSRAFVAQGIRGDVDRLAHRQFLADATTALERACALRRALRAYIDEHRVDHGDYTDAWREGWTVTA